MTFISPAAFDLDVSVRLVLMAAVGGLASIWGAPFGTATVVLLALVLRETVEAISAGRPAASTRASPTACCSW